MSHRILPEFREYERASTTVVNAYLAPCMRAYLSALERGVAAAAQGSGRVDVMQSSGGIVPARVAAREPVRTVLSGPAGGVVGACRMARWAGFEQHHRIRHGRHFDGCLSCANAAEGAERTREAVVAGVPIGVPMLDIHTAGAGGGSIARFDAGGMLRVGPESAGADPGRSALAADRPTVTDANLVWAGWIERASLGGNVSLDFARTLRAMRSHKGAVATVEEFAAGILRVVETQMEKAIRVISVERGHDPRDFTLVAFGGGGPLHACSLARALRIPRVLVPALPGALSAVGILLADTVRDYSRTVMLTGEAIRDVGAIFAELERQGASEFAAKSLNGVAQRSVDLRYWRQGYELNVPYDPGAPERSLESFHELHKQRFGFSAAARPMEIVNLRLRMVAASEPYEPPRRTVVQGDGGAAYYAGRDVYFEDGFRPTGILQARSTQPRRCDCGPGNGDRVYGGHAGLAGMCSASRRIGKSGD